MAMPLILGPATGYHIVHHLNSTLHWSELPGRLVATLEAHAEHDALCFIGTSFFQVGAACKRVLHQVMLAGQAFVQAPLANASCLEGNRAPVSNKLSMSQEPLNRNRFDLMQVRGQLAWPCLAMSKLWPPVLFSMAPGGRRRHGWAVPLPAAPSVAILCQAGSHGRRAAHSAAQVAACTHQGLGGARRAERISCRSRHHTILCFLLPDFLPALLSLAQASAHVQISLLTCTLRKQDKTFILQYVCMAEPGSSAPGVAGDTTSSQAG